LHFATVVLILLHLVLELLLLHHLHLLLLAQVGVVASMWQRLDVVELGGILVCSIHIADSCLHVHGWLARKDSSWTLVIDLVLGVIEEILVSTSATDICSSDHVLVVVVRTLVRSNTLSCHISAPTSLTVYAHLLRHALRHILDSFDVHLMIHRIHLPHVVPNLIATRRYHRKSSLV
jgi:hypothetical protein